MKFLVKPIAGYALAVCVDYLLCCLVTVILDETNAIAWCLSYKQTPHSFILFVSLLAMLTVFLTIGIYRIYRKGKK